MTLSAPASLLAGWSESDEDHERASLWSPANSVRAVDSIIQQENLTLPAQIAQHNKRKYVLCSVCNVKNIILLTICFCTQNAGIIGAGCVFPEGIHTCTYIHTYIMHFLKLWYSLVHKNTIYNNNYSKS